MTESTPPTGPADRDSSSPSDSHAPPPKKRRRRRWPWVIVVILLLLIALVALAPTIASTGAVRSIVVGKINDNLNGKVAVSDWSLGWTSGVRLEGVSVEDQQGRRGAEGGSIRVPAALIGLARGNYDFGEIVIDKPSVSVELYPDGSTNLDHLAKQSTPKEREHAPKEKQPGSDKLPDVKVKLIINELHGTVSGANLPAPIYLDPSNIVVNIPNINPPISDDGKPPSRGGTPPAGTVAFAGTVAAITNNRVDVENLKADQKLDIRKADLA